MVVFDGLQGTEFSLPGFFREHGFGDLDIAFSIGFFRNEVYFGLPDLADADAVVPSEQFKVYDVFKDVSAVCIAGSKQHVPKAKVYDVVLAECFEQLPAFDVVSVDIIKDEGVAEQGNVFLNGFASSFPPFVSCDISLVCKDIADVVR